MTVDHDSHAQALAASLQAAAIPDSDIAGVHLAKRYADVLDDHPGNAEVYEKVGPKYLAALTALGLTKAGRATGDKGVTPNVSPGIAKRDELRERRARRRPAG